MPIATPGVGPVGITNLSVPFAQPTRYQINGVCRDTNGVALANAIVQVFQTTTDILVTEVLSDATGAYSAGSSGVPGLTFYAVAYKAGSPDVMGTTLNTLVATVA